MRKLFLQIILLFVVFGCSVTITFGQMTVQISGPTKVLKDTEVLYTANFYNNGSPVNPPTGGTSYWDQSGAMVIYESSLEYRLSFTTSGSHWVYYEYSTFDNYYSDMLYLDVEGDYCNGVTC